MNLKFLIPLVGLTIPHLSLAEETNQNPSNNNLKPLNNVRVSMQRMLKSTDDQYFLSLYAGIAKPHGSLIFLEDNNQVALKGTQKGNDLILNVDSANQEMNKGVKQITGILDSNSGVFKTQVQTGNTTASVDFEPAFKVENKPLFTFKFYGVKADTPTQEQLLTRVDIINKLDKSVAQTLTGFSAFPNSIGYMDINFDGYYDVILSDLSQDRKVGDKRFIYWMYNPKTQKFQRSSHMEKIIGFPNLQGEKQQIDFGGGQIYQVEKGLLNRIAQ